MAGAGLATADGQVAHWDGTTLTRFGKELTSSAQIGINAIVPRRDGDICVSGHFNRVNNLPAGGAACYDGASKTWTGLGAALPSGSSTSSLAAIGNDLYMTCFCTFPSGAKNIARWDGKEWVDLGGGLDRGAQRAFANGGDLYVVGSFLKAGDVTVNGVARWDGSAWTALGSGVFPVNAVMLGSSST
jgi:hypothetical protein